MGEQTHLIFWLQEGVMHTLSHCRGITSGVSFSRVVVPKRTRDVNIGKIDCVICRDNEPDTTDDAHNRGGTIKRVPVRPSEDVKRAAVKPAFVSPKLSCICICGHELGWHMRGWEDSEVFCEGCLCDQFRAVPIDCCCGHPYDEHRPITGGKYNMCQDMRCRCFSYRPNGKIADAKITQDNSMFAKDYEPEPEPEPVKLPDPVGYVSPNA